ncbi:ThiF family adenylyltransferase [Kribbella sp. VKM Ac-2566]|uniref:ThiF family adenylyltransferase n=1 Tax=Kribbella sp. VKM Ac-2566 TaxID=2512218 RepID=UPI001416FE03|nr:ThiF family adenylyltransferase [Kribbella sp. VKM Ac-2566]
MSVSSDYSRSLLVASAAAGDTGDAGGSLRARIEASRVHVSIDPAVPGSATALEVLVADLRRLPVQLSLDPGHGANRLGHDLVDRLQDLATGIDPDRPLTIGGMPPSAFHARLGLDHSEADVTGAPDGHGASIRRTGHAFRSLRHRGSGLGAMLTAALLTGEVFKSVTGLKPGTYRQITSLDFCPVTLTGSDSVAPAPVHVERLALAGAGAIGTAVALILSMLEATGELIVVDKEVFEPPNVMTYSLGTTHDAARAVPKVDLVKAALPLIDVSAVHGTIDDLIARIDARQLEMPASVLGALDNIAARHDMQRIYPDLILDGGTGGRAGTTVSLHEARPTGPCMRCYFPNAPTGPSLEQRIHEATGLPLPRIARGDDPLTEDDLRGRSPDERRRLRPHLGRPVCGLARLIGLTADDGPVDFRPSAAFVAQQVASLMIGALIARSRTTNLGTTRQVEYDTLYGPHPDMVDGRRPHAGCYCQTSASVIEAVRQQRA